MSITAEKISSERIEELRCRAQDVKRYAPVAVRPTMSVYVDDLLAILSLLQQGEPEGWRPIDTAPKDGTNILVCSQPSFCRAVAFYQNSDWWTTVSFTLLDPMPTHWMPLPPAPGAETGGKKLDIDRDWCIEAAKREEAAGDPDCSVGTFLVPPSPEQEEYLDKVKTLGTEYDRSAIIFSSRQAVLEEAEKSFERIRLLLIQHLQGQAASAFWEAVNARDKIRAMLATTPPAEGERK